MLCTQGAMAQSLAADIMPGQFARVSPSGKSIAFIEERKVYVCRLPNVRLACAKVPFSLQPAHVTSLQWSEDEDKVLVVSTDGAEVIDCTATATMPACKLSNGSGGLGRLSSVEFLSNGHLLSIWEFGKAKIWELNMGRSEDLPDVKTVCSGKAWRVRTRKDDVQPGLLAFISRSGAEDQLHLCFPSQGKLLTSAKLPTVDAQHLSWSPDGKWLAVQDTATACPSLYLCTPDGHIFHSYPRTADVTVGLGIKSIVWSPDNRLLALAKYDSDIDLINTRTFSVIAVVQHTLTIDQRPLPSEHRAPVWQEHISASGVRSYTLTPQPVTPPVSQSSPSTEPSELGTAELQFSCDAALLASRDCRMLNTVWVWNTVSMCAHAIVIQHKNVRRLLWHPTRPNLLLVDCAEEVAYIWDLSSPEPPSALNTGLRPKAGVSWANTPAESKIAILVAEKQAFRLLYPEGAPMELQSVDNRHTFDEGNSEDSLFDILSNRKPLPPKTDPSYTEMVDLEVDAEDTVGGGLDDTFRDKKNQIHGQKEIDPLDDSDIF